MNTDTSLANRCAGNAQLGNRREKRLPYLFDVPAEVRFVSAEPLLGTTDPTTCIRATGPSPLSWIVNGGETGAGARPSRPDLFSYLRDYFANRGIAYFFKQWGMWSPDLSIAPTAPVQEAFSGVFMSAAGKLLTGRVLDGAIHDGSPGSPAERQGPLF